MIRLLTDHHRGVREGASVPISMGIFVPDVKADQIHQFHNWSPSGQVLTRYMQQFGSIQSFGAFVTEIITKASGSALNGQLTWNTT